MATYPTRVTSTSSHNSTSYPTTTSVSFSNSSTTLYSQLLVDLGQLRDSQHEGANNALQHHHSDNEDERQPLLTSASSSATAMNGVLSPVQQGGKAAAANGLDPVGSMYGLNGGSIAGDHCHGPDSDRRSSRQAKRQLSIATCLCLLFVIGEMLGGYYSGSLAIMADAAHMMSDFASFGVGLFVLWLSDKKPRKTMTFGYYRAEALGALATVVIIWYVTGILAYLAIERLHTGEFEIQDNAMLIVAACAVGFNVLLGLCLHGRCGLGHMHSHGGHTRLEEEGGVDTHHSHDQASGRHINIRAALIHVLGDLLQSIGVLISSILIKIFGDTCKIVDPICTLVFAVIVLVTTVSVLRDTLRILAEGAPRSLSYDKIHSDLIELEDVESVHGLHIWSLTGDRSAVAVHLGVDRSVDYQKVLNAANSLLQKKYSIFSSTVQVERSDPERSRNCTRCQPILTV